MDLTRPLRRKGVSSIVRHALLEGSVMAAPTPYAPLLLGTLPYALATTNRIEDEVKRAHLVADAAVHRILPLLLKQTPGAEEALQALRAQAPLVGFATVRSAHFMITEHPRHVLCLSPVLIKTLRCSTLGAIAKRRRDHPDSLREGLSIGKEPPFVGAIPVVRAALALVAMCSDQLMSGAPWEVFRDLVLRMSCLGNTCPLHDDCHANPETIGRACLDAACGVSCGEHPLTSTPD